MNSQVLEYIEEVQKCRKKFIEKEYGEITLEQFKFKMSEKFATFCEKYPMIFDRATDGFFENSEEFNRLKRAMRIINDTNLGKTTKEEGEKEFGQHLVDVFVKPYVPESARKQE
jgi:hypothetical protein